MSYLAAIAKVECAAATFDRVDVFLLIETGKSINCAAMCGGKFSVQVKGGINFMFEHIGKFRRKAGQWSLPNIYLLKTLNM